MKRRAERALESIDTRPYWQWICIDDAETCALCRKRHQRVFHYTDKIWERLPPIHAGCRCRFRALTSDGMAAQGLSLSSGADFLTADGKPK
ncbi:phage minor head protein [Paraburkholderia unamae]|uniref:phage minor head protein n=1 Tax=Paraburkholderia unamae TaxID=219649 RepID=UPI003CC62AD1